MSELALRIKGALDEYGPIPVDDEHINRYFHATEVAFVRAVSELLDEGLCDDILVEDDKVPSGVLYLVKR